MAESAPPEVTVVIPAYNAESTLMRALDSVSQQVFQDWELILIDDGSSDATVEVFDMWSMRVPQNAIRASTRREGPSAARNAGAARARGALIAFLDADDYWDSRKLLRQAATLHQSPDLSGVTCDVSVLDGSSQVLKRVIRFDWERDSINKWITMEGPGPGLCSTLLVRAERFRDIHGFDDSMWNLEDVDLAIRLLHTGKISTVHAPLCCYVMGATQNHTNLATVEKAAKALIAKDPFSGDPSLRERLKSNLALLAAYRLWKNGNHGQALRRLARACFNSPRRVTTRLVSGLINR